MQALLANGMGCLCQRLGFSFSFAYAIEAYPKLRGS